jgi:hypothetical protein
MFSSKICPWSFYAILAVIFLSQTFYQPAEGNKEFDNIVKAFTGEVKQSIEQHSQQQGTHVANNVLEVQQTLLQILFSDCDKLRQFLVAYKQFLQSAPEHYATAVYIKNCDKYTAIIEVGFGKTRVFFSS